jgi:hypothetical protein
MEQIAVLAALLVAILAFLVPGVQRFFHEIFSRYPVWMLAVPLLFTLVFAGATELVHVRSMQLTLMLLVYTSAPVICAYVQGPGPIAKPSILDFVGILLLWLPLEFAAGASLVPRAAQGFLHSVAYGIAILLALTIFVGFRQTPGMKFNPPNHARDWWLPLAAFVITAPVLAGIGVAIGFIPPLHWPVQPAGRMLSAVALIFAGTALPEEILFRSLIQNFIELRFGSSIRTLIAAAVIFGAAHLDNGPQALPNWRYMILATIAGLAYGFVFRKASSVLSSAMLHMLVDWTKHFFF